MIRAIIHMVRAIIHMIRAIIHMIRAIIHMIRAIIHMIRAIVHMHVRVGCAHRVTRNPYRRRVAPGMTSNHPPTTPFQLKPHPSPTAKVALYTSR